MDLQHLTRSERDIRACIRGFLLGRRPSDCLAEYHISIELGDRFRAACIQEYVADEFGP